jgi:multiple sugar transport system substrate-binding protein
VSVAQPFLGETWPAQPAPQFGAIRATGLIEQSVGNAISKRMTPAEAVADAHNKIVQIFEEGGILQP